MHTLQITPIAPLFNKAYKSLVNSVIVPENKVIKVIPVNTKNQFIIYYDGTVKSYTNVTSIVTKISRKKISCLRMNNYSE